MNYEHFVSTLCGLVSQLLDFLWIITFYNLKLPLKFINIRYSVVNSGIELGLDS